MFGRSYIQCENACIFSLEGHFSHALFYVPKGLKDIRMIYNGTASGVNDWLFAPHFSLPTITQAMRARAEGYYQADMDIGEMFLNFMLGEELRQYSGVDVTHL